MHAAPHTVSFSLDVLTVIVLPCRGRVGSECFASFSGLLPPPHRMGTYRLLSEARTPTLSPLCRVPGVLRSASLGELSGQVSSSCDTSCAVMSAVHCAGERESLITTAC